MQVVYRCGVDAMAVDASDPVLDQLILVRANV